MAENKTVKKTKFFTVLAVTVLFVLVLLLVTLLIQIGQLERAKADLATKIDEAKYLSEEIEDKIADRGRIEYIEQMARELGMIGADETLYESAK